jgi:hypothetical protein
MMMHPNTISDTVDIQTGLKKEGSVSDWAEKVISILRPLSYNQNGSYKQIFQEWNVWDEVDNGPDPKNWGICQLCTYEGIRHSYSIRNRITNNQINSVGSKCVLNFYDGIREQIEEIRVNNQRVAREQWADNLSKRLDPSFLKYLDRVLDDQNKKGGISPKQMQWVVRSSNCHKVSLDSGIFSVKLRKQKQKKQVEEINFPLIFPYLTPSQQKKYSKLLKANQ